MLDSNTSGVIGVIFQTNNYWVATIYNNNHRRLRKYFKCDSALRKKDTVAFNKAVAQRKKWETEFGNGYGVRK